LYQAILSEFGHPLPTLGKLNNLRSRTWDNLKRYGVKILIVDKADYLKLEALNELIDFYDSLRISVVLAGTHYLEDVLGRNHPAYVRVSNSFLEWYEFPSLNLEDVAQVIDDWENKFLSERKKLHLTQYLEVVETLKEKSGGLIESLYDILRQIAMFKIEDPDFVLTPSNMNSYLSHRKPPRLKLS
jgi:DNA transposition AAA+ family ATPase